MTAYLLTVNPDVSDTSDFLAEEAKLFRQGRVPEASYWSTRTLTHGAGDRVYLLRQGVEPRGIMASGWLVTGEVEPDESFRGDGSEANYVWVAWDAVLDADDLLPLSILKDLAPNTYWHPNSSGTRVKPEDEDAVDQAWADHLDQFDRSLIGSGEDQVGIEPSYAEALTRVRLHQRAFRRLLLAHYDHECAYCGLDVPQVLDAAHLIPDREGGQASVKNGRLLCANHHRAFDAGLLEWNKKRFVPVKGAAAVPPAPPS